MHHAPTRLWGEFMPHVFVCQMGQTLLKKHKSNPIVEVVEVLEWGYNILVRDLIGTYCILHLDCQISTSFRYWVGEKTWWDTLYALSKASHHVTIPIWLWAKFTHNDL